MKLSLSSEPVQPGYRIIEISKEDGTPFSIDELSGDTGEEIDQLIMRIRSYTYLPVDTRKMVDVGDGARIQQGEVRPAEVRITDLGEANSQMKLLVPDYLVSEESFRTRLKEYIEKMASQLILDN